MQQPSRPRVTQLWNMDRERLFGKFSFVGAPTPGNPEAIRFTDDWAEKNLVKVSIAALSDTAQHGVTNVQVHRQVALSFCALLEAWEDAGVIPRILSWNGAFAPRYKRGRAPASGQPPNVAALSAHSWGSAFDINAPWNPLGREPAAPGHMGSVWDLVEIAEDLGWIFGGRWRVPDGMHFEASERCIFKSSP